MSGVQQRLKLKQTPIDTWSLREQLTLASAVLRSGDQNWVSVSRTMKQFGEPGRPQDWFSQKNCSQQYNLLQERFDIPKRPKRGEKTESGESPEESIVKKLSLERMEELQKILEEEKSEILKLEEETELLSSDNITEEQLQNILREVEAEEAAEDLKEAQHAAWLASREAKKLEIQTILKTGQASSILGGGGRVSQSEQSGSELDSAADSPLVTDSLDSDQLDVESVVPAPPPPPTSAPPPHLDQSSSSASSPLLTALLHSPSRPPLQSPPISHMSTSPYKTPTITPQPSAVTNLSHQFNSTIASTVTISSMGPLATSPPVASTVSAPAEVVASEASVTSKVLIPSLPSLPIVRASSPQITIPTPELPIPSERPAPEPETLDEIEAVNDAVEIMDTSEEVVEHGGQIELETIDNLFKISKSDEDDTADALTDIAELLKDKLREGNLVPAARIEEKLVEQEVTKCVTEEEVSVDIVSQDAIVEVEEIKSEPTDDSVDVSEDIKIDKTATVEDDSVLEKGNRDDETPQRGRGRPKKDSESLEPKLEEFKTEKEEYEVVKEELLEHKLIVEAKAIDSAPDTPAPEDISEEVTTSYINENVSETVLKTSSPTTPSQLDISVDTSATTEKVYDVTNITINAENGDREHNLESKLTETKPATSFHGVDGVESVPCSPQATPCGSRSLSPTSPMPSTTTPPSTTIPTPPHPLLEEDRDYKTWKKSIILVWSQIAQHKNASLFSSAVSEADAPEYRDIVYRPMDLNSIKKNIESGHIKTTEGVERDLMLMFFNAIMYNSSDHEVYNLTRDMQEDTEKIVSDYRSTQALLKASEPKSLRGKSESHTSQTASPAGLEGQGRPRGRSVSGTGGDSPVARPGQEADRRKRERTTSMVEDGGRGEKKRRKLEQ
eukprot:GFUD01030425.1.p1 GENE.GFUD01030425.1~~GFUD01030425.1.p1  ORF type:complete len:900 (-),score=332.97 GFUD01030425.1:356-3055(-)